MTYQYDVFISHSSKNKQVARMLAMELKHAGLSVWFDEWMIKVGDDIYLEVEKGLENSKSVVVLMSPHFFDSEWAVFERSTLAFRDPANKQRTILPVLIEDCDIPQALRRILHFDLKEVTPPRINALIQMIGDRLDLDLRRALHGSKFSVEKKKDEPSIRKTTDREAYGGLLEMALVNKMCLLLYFDVDGFSYINARHGLSVGERILQTILDVLSDHSPDNAFVSRWRADEFVVAIPNKEEREGVEIAEVLVSALNEYEWSEIDVGLFVTISCGIAGHQRKWSQRHVEWVERAILGARSAKIKGGGRVRIGDQIKSSPAQLAKKSAAPVEYLRGYGS